MTDSTDRKAAIAACKDRKVAAGIYAVRCAATGRTWVGRAPNLDAIRNRLWFALGTGGHPNRDLQQAWSAQAGRGFTLEPLERLAGDEAPSHRDAVLKRRLAHWRAALDAAAV